MSVCMTHNGSGIADGRAIVNFLPVRLPVNKQIVDIMILSQIDNVKPEQKPINDSAADNMHVSPAIGNTNVVCQGGKFECLLCGRNKFTRKSPHYCVGGFRKHHIKWKELK